MATPHYYTVVANLVESPALALSLVYSPEVQPSPTRYQDVCIHYIVLQYEEVSTYDHRVWTTGLPIRSAYHEEREYKYNRYHLLVPKAFYIPYLGTSSAGWGVPF